MPGLVTPALFAVAGGAAAVLRHGLTAGPRAPRGPAVRSGVPRLPGCQTRSAAIRTYWKDPSLYDSMKASSMPVTSEEVARSSQ